MHQELGQGRQLAYHHKVAHLMHFSKQKKQLGRKRKNKVSKMMAST